MALCIASPVAFYLLAHLRLYAAEDVHGEHMAFFLHAKRPGVSAYTENMFVEGGSGDSVALGKAGPVSPRALVRSAVMDEHGSGVYDGLDGLKRRVQHKS